jgi:hypothetical protein
MNLQENTWRPDRMKKLTVVLIVFSVLFPLTGLATQKNSSDTGLPKSIDDLYNLSGLIIRGTFIDLEGDSDLVTIHVNQIYKGECGENVSIRRVELQNLAPIENNDCIILLSSLGKIYSLTWYTCNVYHIVDGHVFNNVELYKDTESKFSTNGMPLDEFITEYLTQ